LKVTPELEGEPTLIYTNGHYSMGGKEILLWEYDGSRLNIGVEWNWNFPLQLKIKAPKAMKLEETNHSDIRMVMNRQGDGSFVFLLSLNKHRQGDGSRVFEQQFYLHLTVFELK